MILYPAAMFTVKGMVAAWVAAIVLSACGSIVKPSQGRGRVDDPRLSAGHFQCLLAHHLPAAKVGTTGIQIGAPSVGPTIQFLPNAGTATGYQLQNRAPSAEVIGNALLYPNHAPDGELGVIEGCLNRGVSENQGVSG